MSKQQSLLMKNRINLFRQASKLWRLFMAIICVGFGFVSHAQLLPSIGLNTLPADNATVCTIPWYLGSFYTSGLSEGNFAHDFKLYDLNGDSLVLSQKLATGKPVLLVAGSLTCPVFMGKIPIINQVVSTYGNQIQVYVIYTLEAHPTDTSVYFGYVNIGNQNLNAGILFPQPTTYGMRKHMVDTMNFWSTINAPIFIDGPCNEWWSTFGPAPNNAYLIDTNGKIYAKHGWFHKNNDNIFCDIDSLLGINSGLCTVGAGAGTFQVQVLNNNATGNAGSIVYDYANLVNNSNDNVTIGIKKLQKNLPPTWQTAFCADVCYSPTDDSITVMVPANDTLLFSLDFITTIPADSGSVQVGFRNANDANNQYSIKFRASTYPAATTDITKQIQVVLYPNPAHQFLIIPQDLTFESLQVLNTLGQVQPTQYVGNKVDISDLIPGIYFVIIGAEGNQHVSKFVKE